MLLAFDSTFLFADAERKVHLFSLGIRASAHVICSTYIYFKSSNLSRAGVRSARSCAHFSLHIAQREEAK